MYAIDNSFSALGNAKNARKFLSDIEPSTFGRRSELGDLNFDEAVKQVEDVKKFLSIFDESRMDFLPSDVLTSIAQNVASLSTCLGSVDKRDFQIS